MTSANFELTIEILANEKGNLHLAAQLINHSEKPLSDFQLCFDFSRELTEEKLEGCRLVSQVGSHCVIAPADASPIAPYHHWTFELHSPTETVENRSELPIAVFVVKHGEYYPVEFVRHNLTTKPDIDLGEISLPEATVGVIPEPANIEQGVGTFMVPLNLNADLDDGVLKQDVLRGLNWFNQQLDVKIALLSEPENNLSRVCFQHGDTEPEGYQLSIEEECIRIVASQSAGFFYGLVTLAQLIEQSPLYLNCQTLSDSPRFEYRGHMLDCVRHFHTVETIKQQLEQMAWLKLNRFHWHLTDDEGWRIQIDTYPELTEIGAWRGEQEVLPPQFGSGPHRYGGFYTKEEIRDVVAFATERHIQIVPEIDIPGHARALIKSLPDLLVEPDDRSQYISIQQYSDNVLNPALPATYRVLRDILDEVCELFPNQLIHLGCDEVPQGSWTGSPAALAQMDKLRLTDVRELQGLLLSELQHYLASKGRRFAGWEEAIQGDKLTHDAVIFSWQGVGAGIDAANQGYSVVMTPAEYTYLDMAWNRGVDEQGVLWAGHLNLHKCYHYEPISEQLTIAGASKIKGIQSQVWTEYVENAQRLNHLVFPRLFAIAENGWSLAENKNWQHFLAKLPNQLDRLEKSGVNYRRFVL